MFLLINRFKSDFKCKLLKIADFAKNCQNDVTLCRILGQNDAIRKRSFLDQFFDKRRGTGGQFFSKIGKNRSLLGQKKIWPKFRISSHFFTRPPRGRRVTTILYWFSAFRICTDCLTKYEWILLKIGFKNTYFQVFPGFPAIPASSQI